MALKFLRICLPTLLACVLLNATLRAADSPIQHDMPVADRSSPERIKASIRGFYEVLSALPGEQLENSIRRELAGEADSYLQGYRYAARNEQLYLQLYFDRQAVVERVSKELAAGTSNAIAVQNNQPVLLWLAVTQGNLEALLTEGAQGLLPNALSDVAAAQGQPVVLPADEALARGEVQVAQLRRGEVEPVLRASAKYGMDGVLMGSLMLVEGDQWSATWQIPGAGRQWRSSQGTLVMVIDQGLQGYQQLTRSEPTTTESGYGITDGQVAVSVGGIESMGDFIWIEKRLQSLLGVDQVRAVVVGSDTVLFAVEAAGDVSSVERKLNGQNRLSVIPSQFNQGGSVHSADISYLLQ